MGTIHCTLVFTYCIVAILQTISYPWFLCCVCCVASGRYELTGVLTHKGRSADSGHYVAWTKQEDGKWVLFDDDELHFKTAEDVLALNGGGDWHMAYLLMYKAVTVPEGAVPAAAAAAAAPKAGAAGDSEPEPMKAE